LTVANALFSLLRLHSGAGLYESITINPTRTLLFVDYMPKYIDCCQCFVFTPALHSGAGLYESITMDPTRTLPVDYMSDKVVTDVEFRQQLFSRVCKVRI
jgi:hypothetical protein